MQDGNIPPQISGQSMVLVLVQRQTLFQTTRILSIVSSLSHYRTIILPSRWYSNTISNSTTDSNNSRNNNNNGTNYNSEISRRANKSTGTVVMFNTKLGFGYIKPDYTASRDIFVHYNTIQAAGKFRGLNVGEHVEFEYIINSRGPTATLVTGINGQPIHFRYDDNPTRFSKKDDDNNTPSIISHGTLVSYKSDLGYGFIHPDDGTKDVFIAKSTILMDNNNNQEVLMEGQRLYYEAFDTKRGPRAKSIRIIHNDDNEQEQTRRIVSYPTHKNKYGRIIFVKTLDHTIGYIHPDDNTKDVFFRSEVVQPIDGSRTDRIATILRRGQRVQYDSIIHSQGPTATRVTIVRDDDEISTN